MGYVKRKIMEAVALVVGSGGMTIKGVEPGQWLKANDTTGIIEGSAAPTGSLPITILTSAPSSPTKGQIYYADRATWDPLALGSGRAYMVGYLGSVGGWGALTAQVGA